MFKYLKNKWLYRKSRKAPMIYAVISNGRDWCVREFRFAGKFVWNEKTTDYVPLVYYHFHMFSPYNEWDVRKITETTSFFISGWTFNKERAEAEVYEKKILEEVNYGKVFCEGIE